MKYLSLIGDERAVRRVKEVTSSVLVQSELEESWSAEAMECYCHLRSVQDLLADGPTPCERRFNSPFDGPIIPKFFPISSKDQRRVLQFGTRVLPGKINGIVGLVIYCSWIRRICKQIHHQKFMQTDSNQKQWKFSRENTQCIRTSYAGRAKLCKKDNHYPPLCTKRWAKSGENINKILQKKKKPKIQIRLWNPTSFLEHYRKSHVSESCCSEKETLMFRRTIFRYLWITLMSRCAS